MPQQRLLTQDQQRVADDALQHIRELLTERPRDDRDALWLQQINPETRTISILGERGTGKTFVMMHLLQQAMTEHDCHVAVLPILDATIAAQQDSLRFFIVHVLETFLCREQDKLKTAAAEDGDEATKRATQYNKAWNALRAAKGAMVGTDPAWRQETARLSAAQHDFVVWSEQRVDGTLGFAEKLMEAVGQLCDWRGCDALILPVDDVDLAPQRFLQIVESLNELRYCPRLIVVLAADPYDAELRVYTDMTRVGEERKSIEHEMDDWTQQRRMAQRILAKLLPERYRGYLHSVHPMRRPRFPPGSDEANTGQPAPQALGHLLVTLGVATKDAAFAVGRDPLWVRAPLWGYVLPPSLRALSDMQAELASLVATYKRVQALPPDQQPPYGRPDFWATEEPRQGWVAPPVSKGLAVVARYAGLTRWAQDLDMASYEPTRMGGVEEAMFLSANFAIELTKAEGSLIEVRALNSAVRTGLPLEDWFPLRETGLIRQAGQQREPDIRRDHFAPLCMDVLLRFSPALRLDLPRRWAFAAAILRKASLEVIEASEAGEKPGPQGALVSVFTTMLMNVIGTSKDVPIASSWAELIELLEALAAQPTSHVRFAKGFLEWRLSRSHLSRLLGQPLMHLPVGLRDEAGYVAILANLHKLLFVRGAIARDRARREQGSSSRDPLTVDIKYSTDWMWFSDVLRGLCQPPESAIDNGTRGRRRRPSRKRDGFENGQAIELEASDGLDAEVGHSVTQAWPESKVWRAVVDMLPKGHLFDPAKWRDLSDQLREYEEPFRKRGNP